MDRKNRKGHKKTLFLADYADKGELALLEHLAEHISQIEDNEEELQKINGVLSRMQAEKDGYTLSEQDKVDIAGIVDTLVDRDLISQEVLASIDIEGIAKMASEHISLPEPEKIDKQEIVSDVIKQIPTQEPAKDGKDGEDGKDADIDEVVETLTTNLPQFGSQFRDGLELLPDGEKLRSEAIEGLPEALSNLKQVSKRPVGGSTARNLYQLQDVDVSGVTNDQSIKWNGKAWTPYTPTDLDNQDLQSVTDFGATTTNTTTFSPTGNNGAIIANGSGSGTGIDITHAGGGTKLKIGTTGAGDLIDAGTFNVDNSGNVTGNNLSGTNTGDQDLSVKQDVLVSGTNIKTINSTSLLGSGNLNISGSNFDRTGTTLTPLVDDDTLDVTSELVATPNITGTATLSVIDESTSTWWGYGTDWSIAVYGYDSATGTYSQNSLTDAVANTSNYYVSFTIAIASSNYTKFKVKLTGDYNGYHISDYYYYSETTSIVIGDVGQNVTVSDSVLLPNQVYANDYSLLTDQLYTDGIVWKNELYPTAGKIIGDTLIDGDLSVTNITATDITTSGDIVGNTLESTSGSIQIGGGDNTLKCPTSASAGLSFGLADVTISTVKLLGGVNSTVSNSFFLGVGAGGNITTGNNMLAIGDNCLSTGNGSSYAMGIGSSALSNASSSAYSVGIGLAAGFSASSSPNSIYIGRQAGRGNTSNSETFIVSSTTSAVTPLSTKSFLYGKMDLNGNTANMYLRVNGALQLLDNLKIKLGTGQDAEIYYDGSDLVIDAAAVGSGTVVLKNLPTSSSGLPTGGVWNDSGTLKIA